MCVDSNEIREREGFAEDVDVGTEEPVMFASAAAAWESGVRNCMKARYGYGRMHVVRKDRAQCGAGWE
jgi:hypothetical protein